MSEPFRIQRPGAFHDASKDYDIVRSTARQTALALGLVLPATAFALAWLYHGDLNRSVAGYAALPFGLALAVLEALVFTPVIALNGNKTLRKLKLARDALDRLAHTDPLTGLLNRRGFDQEVQRALASTRAHGRPAAALMCDLDEFKTVNDRFGHDFGDAALRHAADVLRAESGQGNVIVGRQGGEEFVLLMTDTSRAKAIAHADILRQVLAARPIERDGAKATLTMSVGLAATSAFDDPVSDLIARADQALYEAKHKGRNRLSVARDGPLTIVDEARVRREQRP